MVTFTWRTSLKTEPSFMRATAMTFCVSARRMRVFASATLDGVTAAVVYKPVRGERPLWDFPDGTLAGREVSAYLVSQATGWDVVPPTVMRDGPFGPGMCQLWVHVD